MGGEAGSKKKHKKGPCFSGYIRSTLGTTMGGGCVKAAFHCSENMGDVGEKKAGVLLSASGDK